MAISPGRALVRVALRQDYYKSISDSLAKNLAISEKAILNARRFGTPDQLLVLNVSLFTVLYNYDLVSLLEELDAPASEWHEGLQARVLALTVYECLEKMSGLLGKEFQAVAKRWAPPQEWFETFKAVGKSLNSYEKQHRRWLAPLRHHAIGHRDGQAMDQLAHIRSLKPEIVVAAGTGLVEWTNRLYGSVSDLVGHHVISQRVKSRDA